MTASTNDASPPQSYDLLVIGAGQGGGPLAGTMAEAGHSVAIIERKHVGGTCVNEGCTPTKTMVASARVAHLARRASDFGVATGEVSVDQSVIRERKQEVVDMFRDGSRSSLVDHKTLDLIEGHAEFTGERTVEVTLHDGSTRTVTADRIVINTGARPFMPPIKGIELDGVLTSTTIMELDEVPDHLIVLGGGYIGLEFGQMFRRFGAEVTIIERGDQVLAREDRDTAKALWEVLENDGVDVRVHSEITAIARVDDSLQVTVDGPEGSEDLAGTHVLIAAGRQPNTDDLGLDAANVETDDRGHIAVNERLQTSTDGIYAIGDVTGGAAFTHISYDDYRILRDRWLHDGDRTTTNRLVPYTVFTDPQLGRIGLSAGQANKQNDDIQVAHLPMSQVARALETDETRGFMEAVVDNKTGHILGATVLGAQGGEIASALQIAMMGELRYDQLRDGIFSHPTYIESLNNLFAQIDDEAVSAPA
ncbi:mercuric reductase [Longibacter salinarum]|uniref:Mercuric reductase n=1 Tax=Longibacter salinarum TaxID=1850348 RepID=A0A2A8CVN5_9BACT|nr:mercuric reductase [Longibacter salinarum]PEN12657.1 mercuric reductase [Longibacter salinarum]